MSEVTQQAATRLRAVIRTFNRRAQVDTGEGSPTRSQQAVLAWLEDRGPLSASELATLEGIRPQSMSQTVDTLASRGWVTRGAHPKDRRQVLLTLTKDGVAAVNKGRQTRQAWLTDALARRLTAAELDTLLDAIGLLERVVAEESTPKRNQHAAEGR
jgi:DNA-binding MarR family transcriptional regulator